MESFDRSLWSLYSGRGSVNRRSFSSASASSAGGGAEAAAGEVEVAVLPMEGRQA